MNRICNDDNLINVGQTSGLVNIVSDSKELSFSRHDINGMIDCLNDWTIMDMDM